MEHAPGENTGHNESETVSCVSGRPLESAEVQPPQEPGPLSDALFQNFGHSPSLAPSPVSLSLPLSFSLSLSLSLCLSLSSYLSLYLVIVLVPILLTATPMLPSLSHSQHHTSLLHSLTFTNTGITCSCISSTLFGDPFDQGKPIPCWGIPQILINKKNKMRTKVVSILYFSKGFQIKKIKALRPKMTKIALTL